MFTKQEKYVSKSNGVAYDRKDDNVTLLRNGDNYSCVVKDGEEHEISCYAFMKSKCRYFIYILLGFVTGFFVFLWGYLYPCHRVHLTCKPCGLEDADILIIKDAHGECNVCQVKKVPIYGKSTEKEKAKSKKSVRQARYYRLFVYKGLRYTWDKDKKTYVPLSGLDRCIPIEKLTKKTKGISSAERKLRFLLFGPNTIDIRKSSVYRSFLDLFLNPLHFYTIFSCGLWVYFGNYILLAILISIGTCLLLICTFFNVKEFKNHNGQPLPENVQVLERKGEESSIISMSAEKLVPGDVIFINGSERVQADIALLCGNCTVNESQLTGVSHPIHKTSLQSFCEKDNKPDDIYSTSLHQTHTIYRGSWIHSASNYNTVGNSLPRACGIVICTGSATREGRMVRESLSDGSNAKINKDAVKLSIFTLFLLLLLYIVWVYFVHEAQAKIRIVEGAFEAAAGAFPPILPIALILLMTGTVHRFKYQGVSWFNVNKMDKYANIDLVCLDKTGTLTSADVKFVRAIPREKSQLLGTIGRGNSYYKSELLHASVCCHSLQLIQNIISGDPLEIEILKNTEWTLGTLSNSNVNDCISPVAVLLPRETTKNVTGIKNHFLIWKRFSFEPDLRTMSVVATDQEGQIMHVYTKGAPETIYNMCTHDSLPENYFSFFDNLSGAGFRVIAYGTKNERKPTSSFAERIKSITRDEVESQLHFLGFIVFENKIKNGAESTMTSFWRGGVDTLMVTGDNLNTAVSIGRRCHVLNRAEPLFEVRATDNNELTFSRFTGITSQRTCSDGSRSISVKSVSESEVDDVELLKDCQLTQSGSLPPISLLNIDTAPSDTHIPLGCFQRLVVTGDELLRIRERHSECYRKVLVSTKIFARMTPNQKALVVHDFRRLGLIVSMIGDGNNDWLALKTSDAGIRVVNKDETIKMNLMSECEDIESVKRLIFGSRAALTQIINYVKFIVACSVMQVLASCYVKQLKSPFTIAQHSYLNILQWVLVIGSSVGVKTNDHLTKKGNRRELTNVKVVLSIFMHIFIHCAFLFGIVYYLKYFPWYHASQENNVIDTGGIRESYGNTIVFMSSGLHYINLAGILCSTRLTRKTFWYNIRFGILWSVAWVFTALMLAHPGQYVRRYFSLKEIPDYSFSIAFLLIAQGYAFICYLLEIQITDHILHVKFLSSLVKICSRRNQYKKIYEELMAAPLFNLGDDC